MEEEKARKIQEKKVILNLPKEEHFPWALQTGAWICFATGLLFLFQGMSHVGWVEQVAEFVAAVVVFCFGGYLMHGYNRWLIRQITQ